MELLGFFEPDRHERLFPNRAVEPRTLAIIGNVGSAVWPHYETARQNRPHLSLDQWTETVIGEIATDFGLDAVYPFEGPPYHPFIRWAERTGTLFSSPLGLTIHPVYGLWLAFRAALLIDHPLDKKPVPARHPCDDCRNRPCLTACPVGAFTVDSYDFKACLDQVATPASACREGGCLARIACPVGQGQRYETPHAAFHMTELLKAHGRS
ncbi:MAG: ferredoxin [Geminicoccaceae bacterium]